LDETRTHYLRLIGETESAILNGRAELALLEAQLTEEQKRSLADIDPEEPVEVVARVDEATIAKHRVLIEELDHFRRQELSLVGQFTPENPRMKQVLANIDRVEAEKAALEKQYPGLLIADTTAAPGADSRQLIQDSSGLASLVVGTRMRVKLLSEELTRYNELLSNLNQREGEVRDLQRERDLADESYVYFSSSLESASFDEELDPSEGSSIKIVQHPSFPSQDNGDRTKKAAGAFMVLFALGIGLAFAREFVFDQSFSSPLDIEVKLELPLFMSIPKLSDRQPVKLLANVNPDKKSTGEAMMKPGSMPWEVSRLIRPYCDALRDRLIMYFQLKNLHHKPKLVAVTSCSKGAGTTTLSAGLAASLSETGDGKVLLVDMNINRPEMHPFFRGNRASSLSDLLQPEIQSGMGKKENLYLATATERNGTVSPIVPAKFYEMLPQLKSSNFDYIIFDMPAVRQTSATAALSGLMDKVLLVVEPGKTHRDSIKRATDVMRQHHADVAGVVNRIPKSAMKWIQPDLA
jgi:Mrp family chromosome partitioning ATPase